VKTKFSLHLIKEPISVNWLVPLERRGGTNIRTLIYKKVKLERGGEDWFEPALDIHTLIF
jgi:hypothetical protein